MTAGLRRNRLRSALVVAEIALACVLLIGAGLLLQSFLKLQSVPPGFNPARVLTFELGLPKARFEEQLPRASLVERLCERLQALPGVEAAGATHNLPMSGGLNLGFEIEGRPPLQPGQFQTAEVTSVTPDYLKAMQITMLAGRPFDKRDTRDAAPVCLINERLAKRYFANENPIGKRLVRSLNPNTSWEIVGVAVTLAAVGVYGVISFSVTHRTHEFGIRMALGAQTSDVLRLVAREGMLLVACGIGLGVVGALGLTRVIATLLFGVKPTDPMTFVAVVALLGGIGLLACLIPARRATKVDPIEALRRD